MTVDVAAAPPDFDLRDVIDGAALLASTANAVMQLARPAVGYGVLESTVESGQMQLHWTEHDQRQFDFLIQVIASVNRLLPAPVSRFPFNACLQDLRLRMMGDRLIQLGLTVTPRSVRVKNERVRARAG